jgi:hypothetical protein
MHATDTMINNVNDDVMPKLNNTCRRKEYEGFKHNLSSVEHIISQFFLSSHFPAFKF